MGFMQTFYCSSNIAFAIVDKSVIRVGTATITVSLCVQYLGVYIDRHMKKQVSQTISASLLLLPAQH